MALPIRVCNLRLPPFWHLGPVVEKSFVRHVTYHFLLAMSAQK